MAVCEIYIQHKQIKQNNYAFHVNIKHLQNLKCLSKLMFYYSLNIIQSRQFKYFCVHKYVGTLISYIHIIIFE